MLPYRVVVPALLVITVSSGAAQTPLATMLAGGGGDVAIRGPGEDVATRGPAVNNPWVGAQIAYRFTRKEGFADNILVSGKALHSFQLDGAGRLYLPFMGTVGSIAASPADSLPDKVDALLLSDGGATIGAYPYYVAVKRAGGTSNAVDLLVTFHGVAALRANRLRPDTLATPDSAVVTVPQFKLSPIGAEIAIGDQSDGKPTFTFSVAPVVTFILDSEAYRKAFNQSASTIAALELTTIIPIGRGFALLAEGVFASESRNAFRAALITSAETK